MTTELKKIKYLQIDEKSKEVSLSDFFISKWQYYEKSQYNYINFNFNNYSYPFILSNHNSFPHSSLSNVSADLLDSSYTEMSLYFSLEVSKLNDSNQIEEYFYLRRLSFISFFINNMIDVPICFKKSKSLKFKSFELPLLKFLNFLMKKGKKEKINKIFFKTMRVFLNDFIPKTYVKTSYTNWLLFYYMFTNLFYEYPAPAKTIFNFFEVQTNLNSPLASFNTNEVNFLDQNFFFKNFILSKLSQVSPVFSYFIYSVDKNIRKFSRGKSGKYTFVWKYVAPYKRLYLSMRLIAKDIKFFNSKKLNDRLIKTFITLILNLQKSLVWKSKIFSHNYVFKNFKKSLMTSLRTSS